MTDDQKNQKSDNNQLQLRQDTLKKLIEQRDSVFSRLPIVFTLLGTFGLVATYYGFQHIIERIPLLVNNPFITLGVGLAVLIFTGTLYKRLD
ncbi:MAG: hypothetical protein NVS1B10_03080 [Candidatus Saccharimonadales bacterium]